LALKRQAAALLKSGDRHGAAGKIREAKALESKENARQTPVFTAKESTEGPQLSLTSPPTPPAVGAVDSALAAANAALAETVEDDADGWNEAEELRRAQAELVRLKAEAAAKLRAGNRPEALEAVRQAKELEQQLSNYYVERGIAIPNSTSRCQDHGTVHPAAHVSPAVQPPITLDDVVDHARDDRARISQLKHEAAALAKAGQREAALQALKAAKQLEAKRAMAPRGAAAPQTQTELTGRKK
jgi:tetratricopeptide (TPR) repeat protein